MSAGSGRRHQIPADQKVVTDRLPMGYLCDQSVNPIGRIANGGGMNDRSVRRRHVPTVTVSANEKAWSDTGAWPVSPSQPNFPANAILVVDRRPFVRGCLASWLGSFGEEFQTLAVADIETVTNNDALMQAAAVLFGFDRAETADQWLSSQIEWLRERCHDVPYRFAPGGHGYKQVQGCAVSG